MIRESSDAEAAIRFLSLFLWGVATAIAVAACLVCASPVSGDPQVAGIRLPNGFHISLFADSVPNARSLTQSPDGTVFVGTRSLGAVYALRDLDDDGRADSMYTVADGLNMPNGVAWRDGALHVAEVDRVLRFDAIIPSLLDPPEPVIVRDDFPRDRSHGWKFIAFGPDSALYVPVGAPCNVCESPDERYASIQRMSADGVSIETFASGVRNTVGFDWHPETGDLWFTDNGRDWLGDNAPPDELNRAPGAGMHFGFPYCHGGTIADPAFGSLRECSELTSPAQPLGAHVAALGMRFYTGDQFPEEYRHQIFIAEHGSWNSSTPVGYRVSLVRLEGNEVVSYEPFADGWLQADESISGRPVDVLVRPDGSLLVSDDHAGVIYRITYGDES